MKYRSDRGRKTSRRRSHGSVLPVVVFALLLTFAFLALVFDVMREFHCLSRLRYAAQAAALDLLSYASSDASGNTSNTPLCGADGTMSAGVRLRLEQALARSTGANAGSWNTASAGSAMDASQAEKNVLIDPADIVSVAALDSEAPMTDRSELVLQVKARRRGDEALRFIFLPVTYAADVLAGGQVSSAVQGTDLTASACVMGQPASRIGRGAEPGTAGDTKAAEIWRARLACFPLALDYADFNQPFSAPGAASTSITVRAVNAGSASLPDAARGYFVNLSGGGSTGGFYRDAADAPRFDELVGLLAYFSRSLNSPVPQTVRVPQIVERGSVLDRFDSTLTNFDNVDLRNCLSDLSQTAAGKCCIVPVVTPGSGRLAQVTGFAWLKLESVSETSPGVFDFRFQVNESLPVLNASASGGLRSIPSVDGTRMPAPPNSGPFALRRAPAGSSSISPRSRGVVLAPVITDQNLLVPHDA